MTFLNDHVPSNLSNGLLKYFNEFNYWNLSQICKYSLQFINQLAVHLLGSIAPWGKTENSKFETIYHDFSTDGKIFISLLNACLRIAQKRETQFMPTFTFSVRNTHYSPHKVSELI